MNEADKEKQIQMRRSIGYRRCEKIVDLMGVIGFEGITPTDTLQEAIDKLKALNEQDRS